MEVLEEHDNRRGRRQSLQGIAHFTQHALLACTDRLPLQLFDCAAGIGGGRELKRPCWSEGAQHDCYPLAARTTQETAQRIEEREIGLAGTILLNTAAAAHQQPGEISSRPGQTCML